MLRFVAIVLVLPMLASCGAGAAKKEPRPRASVRAMDPHRLMGAMVASYPKLKLTYSDAQDHLHQVRKRLSDKGTPSHCLGRLSPAAYLDVLGPGAAQAPAAVRMWGPAYDDVSISQTVVSLPGGGARSAVLAPRFPENCRAFRRGGLRYVVNEYPVELGDAGYLQTMEVTGRGGRAAKFFMVRFSYRDVYVIVNGPDEEQRRFSELALRKLREASL